MKNLALYVVLIVVVMTLFKSTAIYAQQATSQKVKLYRWYNPKSGNYILLQEHVEKETSIKNKGWVKTDSKIEEGYKSPEANRIALYSWYNKTTNDIVDVYATDFTDEQMKSIGYDSKDFVCFVDKTNNRK